MQPHWSPRLTGKDPTSHGGCPTSKKRSLHGLSLVLCILINWIHAVELFFLGYKEIHHISWTQTPLSQKPASCSCSDPNKHSPSPSHTLISYYYNRLEVEHVRQTNTRHGSPQRFFSCVLCRSAECYMYTSSAIMSVRLSVRVQQLSSHCTECHRIWYVRISWKTVKKIQASINSDKINEYFT